jgi:alkylhydroperoxidase/carboxymuconolactone decarboxylase family protein YurZ
VGLSLTAAIKSLIPITLLAATPQIEELQRHVDAKSLQVIEVDEPY